MGIGLWIKAWEFGLASKEGLETFPSALKCYGSCSPVVENKLGGKNKKTTE